MLSCSYPPEKLRELLLTARRDSCSLRELLFASAHLFARTRFACALRASVMSLRVLRIAAFPALTSPVRHHPSCSSRERLLRASFRSVRCLAASHENESHDAFDRLLPTISNCEHPRLVGSGSLVEAFASPPPLTLALLAKLAHVRRFAPYVRSSRTAWTGNRAFHDAQIASADILISAFVSFRFTSWRCLPTRSEDVEPLAPLSPDRRFIPHLFARCSPAGSRPLLLALS